VGVDDRARPAPRHRRVHALRGLDGEGPALDDPAARPGAAQQRGRARAEAGIRPLSRADEPRRSDRWRGEGAALRDMSHDYLDRLARFAAHTRFDDLPAATVSAARLVLLDTLGAVVAGSALGENRRLARLATSRAPGGRASILGHRGRADASWAALVNATAGVALEMDEGNRLGGGHPAIHVIPAALAVAEERGLGGGQL